LQQLEQLLLEHRNESLHTPPLQVSNAPHFWHAIPAIPQAARSVPGLHTSPSQQPVGQVLQSQPLAHLPAKHLVPLAHCWHGEPFWPQVASRKPGLQKSPSQQPVQEVVVQVHFPLTHPWLDPHTAQAAPPVPQAGEVLPGTQLPRLSQHPVAQVVALHWVEVASHVPVPVQASLLLHAWHA